MWLTVSGAGFNQPMDELLPTAPSVQSEGAEGVAMAGVSSSLDAIS